jgi:nucleoside 2-deoxyribosyltransferase
MGAIQSSKILVVDLDKYGLDTAWEVGYAEGLGKRVIGYNEDEGATTNERFINRRIYSDNFMHGWQNQTIFSDLTELANHCQGKIVYICGSFRIGE